MTAALPPKRIFALWLAAALLFAGAWWWRAARLDAMDPELSALARHVVRTASPALRVARGTSAHVYAADEHRAAAILEEAEDAVPEIARRLGVPPPTRVVCVLMVPNASAWETLVQEKGFRPDSLAVNVGGEIFLKVDHAQTERPDRLAHELTHFVLREAYGTEVPLWLDEGLAGRVGLAVSRAYRLRHGRRMAGSWPGVPAEALEPLSVLTSRQTLPDDPATARVFYRASEELVAMIEDRIGVARMPEFVAEVARGADWRAALDARMNGSPLSSVDIERTLRSQVAAPRKM